MLYTASKPSVLKRSNSERPVSRSVLDEPVGDSCCEARNGGVAFALGGTMKSEINTEAIKKLINTALIVKLLTMNLAPKVGFNPEGFHLSAQGCRTRLSWVVGAAARSRLLAATPLGCCRPGCHTMPPR